MEIKEEFTGKLNKLILLWTTQGIKLNPGISLEDIERFESDFTFSFEKDFCTYLTKVNGFVDFDSDEAWFSFWSQSRIAEENKDGSHPDDVIWFCDHSINLCSFGFHEIDRKIYTHFQTGGCFECVANSFNEFIDLYLQDPYSLIL